MKIKQILGTKEDDAIELWIRTDIIDEIDIKILEKIGYSKENIRKSLEFQGYHRVPSQ